jgi:hypothetical protein
MMMRPMKMTNLTFNLSTYPWQMEPTMMIMV